MTDTQRAPETTTPDPIWLQNYDTIKELRAEVSALRAQLEEVQAEIARLKEMLLYVEKDGIDEYWRTLEPDFIARLKEVMEDIK